MNFWWREDPPLWSLVLWPLEVAYRAGVALHRSFARPVHARVPVISVGNLTVGGAGKTPAVIALAGRLAKQGRRPAVLSRGYGRRSRSPMTVGPDSIVFDAGDEPLLMARRGLRVFVGAERALLAERAVEQGADVLLLDDGLQHRGLARDLDIVVADASNPFGNGCLLPRGPLREPKSVLRSKGPLLLWLTRCDLPRSPRTAELVELGLPLVESAFEPQGKLQGRRAFLFAGVARPASFEVTARKVGAEVAGARWFADHHFYLPGDLALVRREAERAGADVIVTTEKDFVRIDPAQAAGIATIPVDLKILRGEEALQKALASVL